MSFFKKLFFWTKSNRIRESDIKCCPPSSISLSYKFPRRDFYNSPQSHTKLYRNQSCSTYDLSADNSVQCEIHDPPIWHKKSSKTHKKNKSKKNIDSNTSTNDFKAPSIEISIDLPKPSKRTLIRREINITGIEDFIKPQPQKTPIEFVFDDKDDDLSDEEPKKIDFSKLKTTRKEPPPNQLFHFPHIDSKVVHDNKSSDNAFHLIFTEDKQSDAKPPDQLSTLNLPEPKGHFVFDDNGDSSDEI